MNLYIAKISIVLLAVGAVLIGVARSKPVLMAGKLETPCPKYHYLARTKYFKVL